MRAAPPPPLSLSLDSRRETDPPSPRMDRTELHPILQPELLGLNTNAGEKVSLRLLTDDLEGTRNYNDVRRVLLHELSHNRFGDQFSPMVFFFLSLTLSISL